MVSLVSSCGRGQLVRRACVGLDKGAAACHSCWCRRSVMSQALVRLVCIGLVWSSLNEVATVIGCEWW
ncbi:hypothetical protein PanWU01x14_241670, partial [Parasponia andersonii]